MNWVVKHTVKRSSGMRKSVRSLSSLQKDEKQNGGPIPEGKWVVLQRQRQQTPDPTWWQRLVNSSELKEFGTDRIGLIPFTKTETHGRKEFFIHGGKEAGSGHGVDLIDKMKGFVDEFVKGERDLVLVVKKNKTIKHARSAPSNYLFPLQKSYQDKGYHAGARSFGWNRDGGRRHAGCDLYAPLGSEIYAVADGVIIDYHFFYWKTFALEVDHGDFSIVYGEVQPPEDPKVCGITVTFEVLKFISELKEDEKLGLPNNLKKGSTVKQGDHIAYVGQLYKNNGSNPFSCTMLHLEKYSNKATGPFTQRMNVSDYLHIPALPYKRRKDLQDPTEFINKCKLIV